VVAFVVVPKLVAMFQFHAAALELMVTGEEPSTVKAVQLVAPEQEALVVATVPKEFAPVQYARPPRTGALDVPIPKYENAPVLLLYASGKEALSDELEILLLNVAQSPEVNKPRAEAEADGMFNVSVPPRVAGEPLTLMSLPDEPVESAMVLALKRFVPMVVVETSLPF